MKKSRFVPVVIACFVVQCLVSFVLKKNPKRQGAESKVILPEEWKRDGVWYIHTNGDRCGAVILRIFIAHAFARAHGIRYNGICRRTRIQQNNITTCLAGLGFDVESFPFSCPPGYNGRMKYDHPNILPPTISASYDPLTPEWLAHVKSLRRNQTPASISSSSYNVAVHVRRGDVNPCVERYKYSRYLPNSYYLDIIDKFLPKHISSPNVTIYSENKTVESFDDFKKRGYNLATGIGLDDTVRAFSQADLMITSQSTFSIVPSLFCEGSVVVPTKTGSNLWYFRFPNFVSANITDEEEATYTNMTDRLAEELCPR